MSAPRLGSLFSGYGGLERAVNGHYGSTTAWVSDIDKGACKILAHRYPGVPNLGDITTVDWSQVEPVDILTGGSPCQDLRHAGSAPGMTEGTRSNLWVAMREAIAQLRPAVVVWENVRGAYSAAADSEVEPCAGCVGDGSGVHLRALGRVLGDLSDLGYDARWHGLRAADVGAAHGRFRVFVVATDARRGADRHGVGALLPTPMAGPLAGSDAQSTATCKRSPEPAHGDDAAGGRPLLPHATTSAKVNAAGETRRRLLLASRRTDSDARLADAATARRAIAGLTRVTVPSTSSPRPPSTTWARARPSSEWDEWTATMQAKHGNGNGHGKSLAIEAQRLLPTPTRRPPSTAGTTRYRGAGRRRLHLGSSRSATSGATTPPPSPAGSTSSDDQRPSRRRPAARATRNSRRRSSSG